MTTEPDLGEYINVLDDYTNGKTADNSEENHYYQHLRREGEQNRDNAGQTGRNIETMRPESSREPGKSRCKRPAWWVWLLIVIALIAMAAGLAAILMHFLRRARVDCQELFTIGETSSGVYTISPDGVKTMTVYCEQELDGGGWTVFQQRWNGHVDFFRTWNEYKNGFGNVGEEFWLGNDNIHILTAGRAQKLAIDMSGPNKTHFFVSYSEFWIEDEMSLYRLHVSGFYSTPPINDCLEAYNMHNFSTKDRDNEKQDNRPCAQTFYGGWWYGSPYCYCANLNGRYHGRDWTGIFYAGLTDRHESMMAVRMMLKTA